jgi:hypothetical protein
MPTYPGAWRLATSVRVVEWRSRTNISQGGSQRGRSQFPKTVQNEFKNAFTRSDGIRKHMRVLTANPLVAQWRMPVAFRARQQTPPSKESARDSTSISELIGTSFDSPDPPRGGLLQKPGPQVKWRGGEASARAAEVGLAPSVAQPERQPVPAPYLFAPTPGVGPGTGSRR